MHYTINNRRHRSSAAVIARKGLSALKFIRVVAFRMCLSVSLILETACMPPRLPSTLPILGSSSMSVGEWQGVTSQGRAIAFTVSQDEKVTSIALGYDFNGCSGTRKFVELNVPTAPELTCIPGPCSSRATSYRAFGFSDGTAGASYTQLNGVFLPGNQARGQAIFSGYRDCGSATVEWTATRR